MNELEFLDDRLCVTSAHSHDRARHCADRLVSSVQTVVGLVNDVTVSRHGD